ncbi:dihydrofolate reductase [Adhaeribacter swui]|uniref:Dihydrofolate reductase n=1 Tax=Adhaeribacter swui TaxID=2086471 RepID=A0A7G7GCT7_9BACT|nr:dihydrofolate reductase [Adhaeribacter swui]QNF34971.1 dihydrofolate reductase [Adhaeribacter swui]
MEKRKVKLYIATSLDNKIARPDGAIDWLPGVDEGEDYGYQEFLETIDTLLMGYKTYEVCAGFGERPYPDKNTFVFTRDAYKPVIPEAELITQDPVSFVRELLTQDGKDIWLVGGGAINTLLHDAD